MATGRVICIIMQYAYRCMICSTESILLVACVCDTYSGVPDQTEKNLVSIVHFPDYAVSEVVYRNLFQLLPYLDF